MGSTPSHSRHSFQLPQLLGCPGSFNLPEGQPIPRRKFLPNRPAIRALAIVTPRHI